jgi:cytochrome c oxidase subunit 2
MTSKYPVVPIILILIGLGGLLFLTYDSPGQFRPVWGEDLRTSFQSNGERIYYTGFNDRGQRIPITQGPMWLYMHGGGCVDCHGVNGRGGVPVMMGLDVPSDITYDALTGEHEEAGEEEHPPYTDETIKISIRDGLNPAGETLDPTMPRWQMSDSDLDDLLEYLKTL